MKSQLKHESEVRRQIPRVAAPRSTLIQARIKTHAGPLTCTVLDFNFKGARVKAPEAVGFTEGTILEQVEIVFGNLPIGIFQNAKVAWTHGADFGVSFAPSQTKTPDEQIDRSQRRFEAIADFRPQITFPDPIFPGERLHGGLVNISSSGAKLRLLQSAEHLLPEMTGIQLQVVSPLIGSLQIPARIEWVRQQNGVMDLGVSFGEMDPKHFESVLQMILVLSLFHSRTQEDFISTVESVPRLPSQIKHFFRARPIQNAEEFEQVKRLRYVAYGKAGKLMPETSTEDMADAYDDHSISYGIFFGRIMVGTFRLSPSAGQEQPFPFEKIFASHEVKRFTRPDHVEVSRFALIPELQKTDGLLGLFEAVTREAAANRVDLYMCATDRLKKYYLRLGAKVMSKSRPHPVLTDESLTVLKIHSFDVLRGRHSYFFSWRFVMKRYYDAYSRVGWIRRKTSYWSLLMSFFIEVPCVVRRQIQSRFKKKKRPSTPSASR